MRLKYKSSLQRTMIIYFALIGFATALVGVEFIMDTHGKELRDRVMQIRQGPVGTELHEEEVYRPILILRNKAVLMVLIIMVVVIIVLTMFIKNITEPLQHMIEVSKRISAGDLSQTISISRQSELSELGAVINDLTSNLQEILLLSGNMCEDVTGFVSRVSEALKEARFPGETSAALRAEMETLNRKIGLIQKIIKESEVFRIER